MRCRIRAAAAAAIVASLEPDGNERARATPLRLCEVAAVASESSRRCRRRRRRRRRSRLSRLQRRSKCKVCMCV